MAKVFLEAGDRFTLSDPAQVFGSTGDEVLVLADSATGADINANVDQVEFSGNVGDYRFEVQGTEVLVYADGDLMATLGGDEDGTTLGFQDGTADLLLAGLDNVTLGGTPLVTDDGGSEVVPVDFDSPGDGTPVNVNAGNAATPTDAASADVTVVFAAGNYTHTVEWFGPGDVLDLPDAFFSRATIKNPDGTDGVLVVQGDDGVSNVITITLTGVSVSQDGSVYDQASFNSVFGPGALI